MGCPLAFLKELSLSQQLLLLGEAERGLTEWLAQAS